MSQSSPRLQVRFLYGALEPFTTLWEQFNALVEEMSPRLPPGRAATWPRFYSRYLLTPCSSPERVPPSGATITTGHPPRYGKWHVFDSSERAGDGFVTPPDALHPALLRATEV